MTPDNTTIEQPADTESAADAAARPTPSVRQWISGVPTRDRGLVVIGGAVGLVLAAVVSWVFGGGETPADPVPQEPVAEAEAPQVSPPQVGLTPGEYLALGRGAVKEGRLQQAREHLERGLEARPEDPMLRAELCATRSDVAERLGERGVAELYREKAAALMSGLDDASLSVFTAAEAELARGDFRAARRTLHALALSGGHGTVAAQGLRAEAQRRLARAYQAEFEASRGAPLDQIKNVAVFGEGVR